MGKGKSPAKRETKKPKKKIPKQKNEVKDFGGPGSSTSAVPLPHKPSPKIQV